MTDERVTLLAYTQTTSAIRDRMVVDEGTTPSDELAEFAGRVCYAALHKPRAATRSNRAYLRNIIDLDHGSVLAHAHAAVLLERVSRSCTHELIRSVFLAYSQESQRYVPPPLDVEPVIPPDASEEEAEDLRDGFRDAVARYRDAFVTAHARARLEGLADSPARKRAAAVARAWLPNATPTTIVVSGNMRAWRDFFAQRTTEHAEAEIREVSRAMLAEVGALAPAIFQDFLDEPVSAGHAANVPD